MMSLDRGRLLAGVISTISVVTFAGAAKAGEDHRHDGLYLRLGGGVAYVVDSLSGTISVPVVNLSLKAETTPKGFGGATELAVGYAVADGLVLGGGLYSVWFSPSAPSVTGTALGATASVSQRVDFDASSFHVVGPFIDGYPDPDGGFHLQGGLGFGWVSMGGARFPQLGATTVTSNDTSASGFGAMLGLGYEWWVSSAFGLGLSARLTMGFLSGNDANVDWSHTIFAPALLFTVTMN